LHWHCKNFNRVIFW